MINRLIIVSAVLIGCWIPQCMGQHQEVKSTTEQVDSDAFKRDLRTYNKIFRPKERKVQLVKLDLTSPFLYTFFRVNHKDSLEVGSPLMMIGYERKLSETLGCLFATRLNSREDKISEVKMIGGLKYYYNLGRRILRGYSENNFSANYISIQFNHTRYTLRDQTQPSFLVGFGIERRLGKYGYMDFIVGGENIFNHRGQDFDESPTSHRRLYVRFELGIGI